MTTVNVTTQTNTVEITAAGATTVVQVPKTSTVTATTAGPQGIQGATGTAGADGVDGVDGADGADGVDGVDGADGADGVDGADGADGAAATIAVGTVTTGAAGSSATVTNSGTSAAAVFDFAIPQGATGATGPAGADGADGADGGTDIVLDTSPQLGGDLASNGHDILVADNDRLKFGAGNDLQIYHNSANGNSVITESGNGNLNISADNLVVYNSAATETKAKFVSNGAVALYYDNVKKFETTTDGIAVIGNIVVGDDDRLKFGADGDLEIYYDGAETNIGSQTILNIDTTRLRFRNADGNKVTATFTHTTGSTGGVQLYFDGNKKFETTTDGIAVTGTCVATEFSGSGASLTSIGTTSLVDDAVTAAKLADTAVTAGSYTSTNITVDAQGRITAAANGDVSIYAKFFGTGSTNFNPSTGAVRSWLNTTAAFSSGSWSATSSEITVPAAGLYMISVNIYFVQDTSANANARSNPRVSISINGTAQTERTAHSYMRNNLGTQADPTVANNHIETSANGTFYYQLSANDEIGVYSQRLSAGGVLNVGSESAITIVKIA